MKTISNDNLTRAESDLIELLRGQDAETFSVKVTCDGTAFRVVLGEEPDDGIKAIGEGSTFSEAWGSMRPNWTDKAEV